MDYPFLDYTFYQLMATGVIATCASVAASSVPCAFSAAVNAIASVHYYLTRQALQTGADSAFETAVQLRYSDWAVTLPLMGIELHLLAEKLDPGYSPSFYPKELSAFALLCVVTLGAIWSFSKRRTIGFLCFAASCILMGSVLLNLLSNIDADRDLFLLFTLPWIGYPVVSIAEATLFRASPGFIAGLYAVLDLWSKAGLALAVSMRA